MKIGIVTATYRKLDGSTYAHLKETLESVKNQTHQDYKVFLIGDDYSDNDELLELSKIIDDDKIYVENLPIAVERIKYDGYNLWKCGGANATNVGIKKALSEGYEYICLLNHDDVYFEDHLSLISECIEKTGIYFVTTRCSGDNNINYPPTTIDKFGYYNYIPQSSRLYLVSVCLNYKYYNILMRNMIEECGISYPSDADMWNRISEYMRDNNENGIFINKITCEHLNEYTTCKNPEIVK